MGSQLVRAAYTIQGPRLNHRPMRLLAWMALAPRDDDPAPTYYAGHEQLAIGLGYRDPGSSAAQRAVIKTVRELVDAGVITPLGNAHTGNRQRYRLDLWTTDAGKARTRRVGSPQGYPLGTPEGSQLGTPEGKGMGTTEGSQLGTTEGDPHTQRSNPLDHKLKPTPGLPGDVTQRARDADHSPPRQSPLMGVA